MLTLLIHLSLPASGKFPGIDCPFIRKMLPAVFISEATKMSPTGAVNVLILAGGLK